MLDMPSLIKRWKRVSHGQLELYVPCFELALLTSLDRWANTDGPSSPNKQEDYRWNDCFLAPCTFTRVFLCTRTSTTILSKTCYASIETQLPIVISNHLSIK